MTDGESATQGGLTAIAADGGMDALEAAWLDQIEQQHEASYFLDALQALPEAQRRSVAPALLLLLLESYQGRNAHSDILATAQALLPYRPKKIDLIEISREALTAMHGSEEWFALFLELSGFGEDADDECLEKFEKLRSLLPGSVVYHRTGWGEGLVTRIDVADQSFFVRFRSESHERSMPFTTGLDVLDVLAPDDLRTRLLTDAEGLARDAAENPAELIKAVARLYNGRVTAKEIKERLIEAVVPTSSWASWWRKAKTAAARDPYLSVDNPSRPTFILRNKALSPEDEIRDALSRAAKLENVLEVVRGPLSLDPDPTIRDEMLDRVAVSVHTGGTDVARSEGILILARHERVSVKEAGEFIAGLLGGAVTFGDLAARLSPATLRREAFEAFAAADPQLWSDTVIGDLPRLPPGLLDLVSDRLVAEGRGPALANRMAIFLMSPSRQPATVIRLAKRFTTGLFDGIEGAPGVTDVFMGLLHLAETQAPRAERGDKGAKDAIKGIEDLLAAKRGALVNTFTESAKRSEMERAMGVLARCKTIPDGIRGRLSEACNKRFPDLVPRDETPFWESTNIFCSRDGLARRQEEYRVLIEEQIPENSETIGRAAAYGDLSENYEWTAAIEQQRQLTEKAAAMEAELKLARAIEDQVVEEDVVCPGCRVTYEEAGVSKTIMILGPWDTGDGVVSYRAPVASGMLGAKVGDGATLELPDGPVDVVVRSLERVL